MSSNTDKITTIVGAISGISLIAKAWGVINEEQHDAIINAAPYLLAGVALILAGYHVGKK
jgi:hypothetical protein